MGLSFLWWGRIYLPPPHFFPAFIDAIISLSSLISGGFSKPSPASWQYIWSVYCGLTSIFFFLVICRCYLFIKAFCFNPRLFLKKNYDWSVNEEVLLSSWLNYRMVLLLCNLSLIWLFIIIHIYSQPKKICC